MADEEPGRVAEDHPVSEEFRVWEAGAAGTLGPNHLGTIGVELSKARTYKSATLTVHGDPETGEITRERLKVMTAPRDPNGPGYDFDHPTKEWLGANNQIARLRAFLNEELAVGRYRIINVNTPTADLLALLEGDEGRSADLLARLATTLSTEVLADVLQTTATGQGAAQLAEIERRRSVLHRLDSLLADPATTERRHLHPILKRETWVFGARFIASLPTRLVPRDEYDLALLAADGSVHIIELKGARIPSLVRRHRSHWTVGTDVHEATMQAANYVRETDAKGDGISATLRNDLGLDIDVSRAFATVVIGDPRYQTPHEGLTERSIAQAFRTYNAMISRVEVLTYRQLVDTARRSLTFVEAPEVDAPADGDPF